MFKLILIILFILTILIFTAGAAPEATPWPHTEVETGSLVGDIQDFDTREALGWTILYIEELNRSVSAHEDGSFHFFDLPAGEYMMQVMRVGYHEQKVPIKIESGKTKRINIIMNAEALYGQTIVVEAEREGATSEIARPGVEVSGKKLRQNLGRTVAETIDYELGVSQRTMGPAPARPVLRGLGGDRLLIMEDGQRTGDLSGTSADHAVAVEPMTAERIEVIRGPEAIIYGSNSLGGIVNIGRDYVLAHLPHRVTGSLSMQGETVNSGYAPGLSLAIPIGAFGIKTDGSLRRASDIYTPVGTLENTAIQTVNGSIGIGYYQNWGFLGAAFAHYKSQYGIPGLPDTLGGHPGGVDIDMKRQNQSVKGEVYPGLDWLDRLQAQYTRIEYYHAEYEASGSLGMEFGVITHNIESKLHLKDRAKFSNGQFGIWGQYREFATGGLSFTPDTKEYAGAVYYYQEYENDQWAANATLRWDFKIVNPNEYSYSEILNGEITRKEFNDFSGGISVLYRISAPLKIGIGVVRTFRAPGVEELFSEGPHLAAYAYEVGNPELSKENGLSTELTLSWEKPLFNLGLALFRNDIRGYIFPKNTGGRSWQRNDLFVYRYVGERSLMYGVEASYEWHFYHHFKTGGTLSYVHGELVERNEPIPRIPPLEAKLKFYHDYNQIVFGTSVRAAAAQKRTGVFENPTDGYVVFDLFGSYNFSGGSLLHTLALSIENIGNVAYYKHLNRVKEIMPEPGRNFKLLYKLYF